MAFPRQEYWSGLPFPSPGDLPNLGIKAASPTSPALAGGLLTVEPAGKPTTYCQEYYQSPGLSHVQLYAIPRTIACQALLSVHGILQARILEWVAIPFQIQGSDQRLFCRLHWRADSLPPVPPGKPISSVAAQLCPLALLFSSGSQ